MAQQECQSPLKRLNGLLRNNHALPPENFHDLAEDIAGTDARIVLRHGIAASDAVSGRFLDKAMNHETLLPLSDDNVSANELSD